MRPRHAMGDQTSTATTRRALSGATLDLPEAAFQRLCQGRDIAERCRVSRAKLISTCVKRLSINR